MRRDRMMLALATALGLVLAPWAGAQNQGTPREEGRSQNLLGACKPA